MVGVSGAELVEHLAGPVPEILLLGASGDLGVFDQGSGELQGRVEPGRGRQVVSGELRQADAFGQAEQATLSEAFEVAVVTRKLIVGGGRWRPRAEQEKCGESKSDSLARHGHDLPVTLGQAGQCRQDLWNILSILHG